jgi:hypothetical protein
VSVHGSLLALCWLSADSLLIICCFSADSLLILDGKRRSEANPDPTADLKPYYLTPALFTARQVAPDKSVRSLFSPKEGWMDELAKIHVHVHVLVFSVSCSSVPRCFSCPPSRLANHLIWIHRLLISTACQLTGANQVRLVLFQPTL